MKTTLLISFLAIFGFNYANAQCNPSFISTDNGGGNWDFTNTSNWAASVEWWIDGNNLYTTWDANHTFSVAGQHTIALYLYDSMQVFCDSSTQFINVTLTGCVANFTTTNNGGGNYDFTNTSGGNIGSQQWWVDGTPAATTVDLNQTLAIGSHNICLYNYDSLAVFCDSTCTIVNVNVLPCQANFWWFPDSMNQNLVWVINNSTGNNLTYFWDFGDNTTSTQAYPTHTYAGTGPYNLCLAITATNPSCTDSMCLSVTLKMPMALTINVVPPAGAGINTHDAGVEVGSLYPNPVENIAFLPVNLKHSLDMRMEVLNIMGQAVYSETMIVPAGSSKLQVPATKLTHGSYLIRLTSEDGAFNHTIPMMR